MRTKQYRKKKIPNSPDKNNLIKTKAGLVFIFIGSYFFFFDVFGSSPFTDNFNYDQSTASSSSLIAPLFLQNGKMASSMLFYMIALFFFGWEVFDIKIKK
ncbi:hypothetical protein E9993_17160 [Labilibacter sediminis]|nr:hypothetical protein E9993_17160 [Labilibacter sediminis]